MDKSNMSTIYKSCSEFGLVAKEDYLELAEGQTLELALTQLKKSFSYLWLFNIYQHGKNSVRFLFIEMEQVERVVIQFDYLQAGGVPSIQFLFRNGYSFERKLLDQGIPIIGKAPSLDFFEQEKALGEERFTVKKRSPFTGHTEDVRFKMIDNLMAGVSFQDGEYHIGLEKMLIGERFVDANRYVESYFSSKAPLWSFLLCHGAEEGAGIDITDRAKAMRMILLELSRINDHLYFFFNISKQFKCESLYSASLVWIKRVKALFLSYSGNENAANAICFGGMIKDVSQVWLTRTLSEILWIMESVRKVDQNLSHQQSFKDEFSFRLFSKNLSSLWGVSGPVARAMGMNIDYRKLNPIYFYNDIDFDVPLGAMGTAYDLIKVRFEEIYQSIKIIIQVLDNLPTGNCLNLDLPDFHNLKDAQYEPSVEEYSKSVKQYESVPNFSTYNFFEGGEGIYHVVLEHDCDQVKNICLGSPLFATKDFFQKMIKGNDFERVFPLWSVLNINLKEVEL